MLVPLLLLALGAVRRRLRLRTTTSSARTTSEFWGRVAVRGRAQPHPARDARGARLGRLRADSSRCSAGFALAYALSTSRVPSLPAATARGVPAALPVPAQQVVLRRALRLALRAPGIRHRPAASGRAATAPSSTAGPRRHRRRRRAGSPARVVKLQTGYLYHYAFAMLIGVAAARHLVHVARRSWR